jgi:hypothetical protein
MWTDRLRKALSYLGTLAQTFGEFYGFVTIGLSGLKRAAMAPDHMLREIYMHLYTMGPEVLMTFRLLPLAWSILIHYLKSQALIFHASLP